MASNFPPSGVSSQTCGHVLRADADHPEQMAATAKLLERRQGIRAGNQHPSRPLAAHRQHVLDVRVHAELSEQSAEVIRRRPGIAIGQVVRREPCLHVPLGLDADRLGHLGVEARRLLHVPRDQRLPEVEDDRAVLQRFLSSFLTSPHGRVFRI